MGSEDVYKRQIQYDEKIKKEKVTYELDLANFVDVKGWKSIGNKLSDKRITGVKEMNTNNKKKLSAGDTVEFDVDEKGQKKMF